MHGKNERGKRGKGDYAQVSGYIPKNLAIAFKTTCTARELTQSETLENLISEWLEREGIDVTAFVSKQSTKEV